MAEILISPGISMSETDKSTVVAQSVSAGAALVGPTVKGPVLVPTVVSSYRQYQQIFGTTFDDNGTQREFLTSMAAKYWFENSQDALIVSRVADPEAFTPATASISGSNCTLDFATIGSGKIFNTNTGSADSFKLQVVDVDEDANTFTLVVRQANDDEKNPVVLETFRNLSLDPTSSNYVTAVIGDQYTTVSEGDLSQSGNYVNSSAYIRVKSVSGSSVKGISTNSTVSFSGASGSVGVCYKGGTEDESGSANYFEDIKSNSTYPQAVAPSLYETAFDLLANTDEYNFSIISAPGLRASDQLDSLVSLAEERGDCIAVIDEADCDTAVSSVSSSRNSSYAAAYFPWLQMYSSTGKLEWVPASVAIPGVYAANDASSAPWYVPAGMTRGIVNAVQAKIKLTKKDRDALYKKNINPIAVLNPVGLVAYGQKTLQKKASALDRVNVRRLLIELKKTIKEKASSLLFEQNTSSLRESFRAQVETYLASVVNRNGLYAYQVDLSGNTNEAIDRNEFHCAITLQPTKAIEFIYLSFNITSTGVDFE